MIQTAETQQSLAILNHFTQVTNESQQMNSQNKTQVYIVQQQASGGSEKTHKVTFDASVDDNDDDDTDASAEERVIDRSQFTFSPQYGRTLNKQVQDIKV